MTGARGRGVALRAAPVAPLALLTALATGCQTVAVEGPARMSGAPSALCLTQLTAFASGTSKRNVTLTEQAFAQSDQLLLERPLIRGADGRLLDGRSMDRPEVYRLVRKGNACSVIHANSGARSELPSCNCTSQ
jgi:hypothetical protein